MGLPLPEVAVLSCPAPFKARPGYWIDAATYRAHLAGTPPSVGDLVSSSGLWTTEFRLGIGMDRRSGRVIDGLLYTADVVTLRLEHPVDDLSESRRSVRFVVAVDGIQDQLARKTFVRLGGDGRGAAVTPIDPGSDGPWAHRPAGGKRFRMVLSTPGIFPEGWLPPGVDNVSRVLAVGGRRARLVAACVGRHEVVSGWDVRGKGRPKPAQRVVPAGSVYWFEWLDGAESGAAEDISPVHMGAGTAVGVIDNPIQRERHTGHPMMAGSGVKGAIRHHLGRFDQWNEGGLIDRVFGPEPTGASEHASAVSFTDAQIVLFPVRSLRQSFVYATCPTALARLERIARLVGATVPIAGLFDVSNDQCHVADDRVLVDGKLVLEAFDFDPVTADRKARGVSRWLKQHALPADDGSPYFLDKLEKDLVVLSDDRFNHFAKHSTVVEPHVCIDDLTGTAEDKKLFYTENLPPESLLVALCLASRERLEGGADAKIIMQHLMKGPNHSTAASLDGKVVQFGGDATTGRGLVVVRFTSSNGGKGDAHVG
ncbi:MAG: type III-B CRISPR module RAMP protein Cmr4 [Candidatus Riflebacteria bacterium]|nr:type III-B CRISPR module RAMP protein Cmr4 [Candidatus Riflebacteria bacterium]